MKIGFIGCEAEVLESYWERLDPVADCWWAVTEPELRDYLVQRNISKFVYVPESYVLDTSKTRGNQRVPVRPGRSQSILASIITPDLWIADQLNKLNYVEKKVPWVQVFHGMPIKSHFFYHMALEYDLLLLPGYYHEREFVRRYQLSQEDRKRLKVVGWPKVDPLCRGNFDRQELLSAMGLDCTKRTLMYAPTWGLGYGNNSFFARWFGMEAEIFERVCLAANRLGLNFIVRLHNLSFQVDNLELQQIASKYNVLWPTRKTTTFKIDDPNEYLWITDILISDMSSIISEFLVMDRPIIFIDPDEQLEVWQDSDMPKNFRAGSVVKTPDELIAAIEEAVQYPNRYQENRHEMVQKLYCSTDGRAIDRAVKEIQDFACAVGLE